MTQLDALLLANQEHAAAHVPIAEARPQRRLAVVTCMDTRIDVLAALGLQLGDAHVIRNAGGRVTDDVLRSLTLSTQVLGVDTVVVIQHTKCGLLGVTDEELHELTGSELEFLTIHDHRATLEDDIRAIAAKPYLQHISSIGGLVYDVESGELVETVRWQRDSTTSA